MAKRFFDFLGALTGLIIVSWLLVVIYVIASIDTASNAWFVQERIGQFSKTFRIFKFKTIHPQSRNISSVGRFLRNSKLDELPQLLNVLLGNMSLVGPRPDIKGYYDLLEGDNRQLLELKPGITGPASLKYANEAYILAQQENPLQYNDTIIFPDKVKINLEYQKRMGFFLDLKILIFTVLGKRPTEDYFN